MNDIAPARAPSGEAPQTVPRRSKEQLWYAFVESRDFPPGLTVRLKDFEHGLRMGRTGTSRWLAEFEAYQEFRELARQ